MRLKFRKVNAFGGVFYYPTNNAASAVHCITKRKSLMQWQIDELKAGGFEIVIDD